MAVFSTIRCHFDEVLFDNLYGGRGVGRTHRPKVAFWELTFIDMEMNAVLVVPLQSEGVATCSIADLPQGTDRLMANLKSFFTVANGLLLGLSEGIDRHHHGCTRRC